MAKTSVSVEWIPSGLREFFKYSEEVSNALMQAGEEIAKKNSASAARYIHDSRGFTSEPYAAEIRRLERTQVCVVHSTNKIAAAIGRKHRLPKK